MIDSPDCALTDIGNGKKLASSTDFFYPLVDDPFYQGKIGAANVLSDLFAAGVLDIQHMLMILAVSNAMTSQEQDICTKMMIEGFSETVKEAKSMVVGGQTVINKWPMIGGTAIGFQHETTGFYSPTKAQVGDVLVITKPLGAQMVVNFNQYYKQNNERWQKLNETGKITAEDVQEMYDKSQMFMSRLNRNGAILMLKYGATSSTDVTGFGIQGHAQNICEVQKNKELDYVLERLPCYKKVKDLDGIVRDFKLKAGFAAETSGGLLISLPKENVDNYVKDMHDLGEDAWVVGKVVKGTGQAIIPDDCEWFDI